MARVLVNQLSSEERPNLIINGAMDYWQRALTHGASTTSLYRGADRFLTRAAGVTTNFISERSTDVPTSEFKYSFKSTAAGDLIDNGHHIMQRIEADRIKPLIGKVVTFSFWYKVGLGNQPEVLQPNLVVVTPVSQVEDDWAVDLLTDTTEFTEVIGPVTFSEWIRASYTFVVPADAQYGLGFRLSLSSFSGNAEYYTTGWMLHEGSVAQPFRRAASNLEEEFRLCQRYYEKSYRPDQPVGTDPDEGLHYGVFACGDFNTDRLGAWVSYKVPKRVDPTLSFWSANGAAAGNWFMNITQNNVGGGAGDQAVIIGSGSDVNGFIILRDTSNSLNTYAFAYGYWAAEAEL